MRRLRSTRATAIASAALLIKAVMLTICSSGLLPSRRCIISGERANDESNGGREINPALPSDTCPKWRSNFEKLKVRSTFEPENTKPLRANFTPSITPCTTFRLKIVSTP